MSEMLHPGQTIGILGGGQLGRMLAMAAARLGFSYEGTHRQATHYKGRNRDTAWFSILDSEWPAVRAGFEAWLAPANFDEAGRQRRSLSACRAAPEGSP